MRVAFLLLASFSAVAQETIFLHGSGIQTVKVQNLQPGVNAAGVEFVSHDGAFGGTYHSTARVYGVFDGPLFEAARLTIATRGAGGAWVPAVSIKNGKVGIGTDHPEEALDVRGVLKVQTVKTGFGTGVTLNCPSGIKITRIDAGIVLSATCNP